MPDKNMDIKKVDVYRKRLLDMKENLLKDIKSIDVTNAANDVAVENPVGHGMHMADGASEMYDREFSLNLASNDRELLQKINSALGRIEAGRFGMCMVCGGGIPSTRLMAIPYAETCLKCQEELEKNVR